MSNVQNIEADILGVVRDYVGSRAKQLSDMGLTYEISVTTNSSESDGYRSEVLIEFSDENGPWDMLEFEIARRNDFLISVEDVINWLPGAFNSVVSRREVEAPDSGPATVH